MKFKLVVDRNNTLNLSNEVFFKNKYQHRNSLYKNLWVKKVCFGLQLNVDLRNI